MLKRLWARLRREPALVIGVVAAAVDAVVVAVDSGETSWRALAFVALGAAIRPFVSPTAKGA